jgi:hypothetical protein
MNLEEWLQSIEGRLKVLEGYNHTISTDPDDEEEAYNLAMEAEHGAY